MEAFQRQTQGIYSNERGVLPDDELISENILGVAL